MQVEYPPDENGEKVTEVFRHLPLEEAVLELERALERKATLVTIWPERAPFPRNPEMRRRRVDRGGAR